MAKRKKGSYLVFSDPHIQDRLNEIRREFFDGITGPQEYGAVCFEWYGRLTAEFGVDRVARSLMLPLMVDALRSDVERRASPGEDLQGDLFSDAFLGSVMKIDEGSFTKTRFADRGVLLASLDRQREDFRRKKVAMDRSEERAKLLLGEGGMDSDPSITIERAVARIKRKYQPRPPKGEQPAA